MIIEKYRHVYPCVKTFINIWQTYIKYILALLADVQRAKTLMDTPCP